MLRDRSQKNWKCNKSDSSYFFLSRIELTTAPARRLLSLRFALLTRRAFCSIRYTTSYDITGRGRFGPTAGILS